MYYDRQGRLKCAIPRERLEVRTGEVSKGATRRNALYKELVEKMAVLKAHAAALPRNSSSAKPTARPTAWKSTRVSAAVSPLTYAAGGNYPGWLIQEDIGGQDVPFSDDWENNLIMLRYDAKVLVREHD